MSDSEKISVLEAEIKTKERQLYRANKEANAWNKGGPKIQHNANQTKLFLETQRREIDGLRAQLLKLKN